MRYSQRGYTENEIKGFETFKKVIFSHGAVEGYDPGVNGGLDKFREMSISSDGLNESPLTAVVQDILLRAGLQHLYPDFDTIVVTENLICANIYGFTKSCFTEMQSSGTTYFHDLNTKGLNDMVGFHLVIHQGYKNMSEEFCQKVNTLIRTHVNFSSVFKGDLKNMYSFMNSNLRDKYLHSLKVAKRRTGNVWKVSVNRVPSGKFF